MCEDMDYINQIQDQEPVAVSCDHVNELSSFIKGEEFLDQLRASEEEF
jgi:hypothetical protein